MQLTKRQQQIFDIFLEMPSEPRTISDFAEPGPETPFSGAGIYRSLRKIGGSLWRADFLH